MLKIQEVQKCQNYVSTRRKTTGAKKRIDLLKGGYFSHICGLHL